MEATSGTGAAPLCGPAPSDGRGERPFGDGRAEAEPSARFPRYLDDFPAYPINNVWLDIGGIQSRADPKVYVVPP